MGAEKPVVDEFIALHDKFTKANQRMSLLQKTAIEGLLHIGVGCVNEASRQEFKTLKSEIEQTLNRMDEICDKLH